MKRYFDNYKYASDFMEKIGYERVIDYGRTTVFGEIVFYVKYIYKPT